MKLYAFAAFMLIVSIAQIEARTPLVCEYTNLSGTKLTLDAGRSYVDFGTTDESQKICVQRAKCTEDYKIKLDKCTDVALKVNCEEFKKHEHPDFPFCCVRC